MQVIRVSEKTKDCVLQMPQGLHHASEILASIFPWAKPLVTSAGVFRMSPHKNGYVQVVPRNNFPKTEPAIEVFLSYSDLYPTLQELFVEDDFSDAVGAVSSLVQKLMEIPAFNEPYFRLFLEQLGCPSLPAACLPQGSAYSVLATQNLTTFVALNPLGAGHWVSAPLWWQELMLNEIPTSLSISDLIRKQDTLNSTTLQ